MGLVGLLVSFEFNTVIYKPSMFGVIGENVSLMLINESIEICGVKMMLYLRHV